MAEGSKVYKLELTRDEAQMLYTACVVLADTKRRASVNDRFSDQVKEAFVAELRAVEQLGIKVAQAGA